jgi:hypothetical protein
VREGVMFVNTASFAGVSRSTYVERWDIPKKEDVC